MSGSGGVFGSGRVVDRSDRVPLGSAPVWGHLVPVTRWVQPERVITGQPYRGVGGEGQWRRHPYLLTGGVVLGVGVVAALVVCLVIALLALVAWVSAHAVAVGAAVVGTALVFLRALTSARQAGPPLRGGWCEWGDHHA